MNKNINYTNEFQTLKLCESDRERETVEKSSATLFGKSNITKWKKTTSDIS